MASWLSGLAVLWHPAVLWNSNAAPVVDSVYDYDPPKPGQIYALPESPSQYMSENWLETCLEVGALSVKTTGSREEAFLDLRTAFQQSAESVQGKPFFGHPEQARLLDLPHDQVRPFLGLGFMYLVIDALFEAMDHQKLLDYEGFWADVQAAIQALISENPEQAWTFHLEQATMRLMSARDVLYSMPILLLDIWHIRTSEDCANPPVGYQLSHPTNILVNGATLEQLATTDQAWLEQVRQRLDEAIQPPTLELVGGIFTERPDALLPINSELWNYQTGRKLAAELNLGRIDILARTSASEHPMVPSLAQCTGYKRVLLVPAEDAVTPSFRATIINWTAPDGKSTDAFCRKPLPANKAESFFNLVYHLHESISQDSTPTLAFIHNDGTAHPIYEDWLSLSQISPALGQWMTFSEYFGSAMAGDYIGITNADDFFADHLEARVNTKCSDPVSAFARFTQYRREIDIRQTFAAIHRALNPTWGAEDHSAWEKLQATEKSLESSHLLENDSVNSQSHMYWPEALANRIQSRSAPNTPGWLVLNPCAFTRRVAVDLEQSGRIPLEDPVKAVQWDNERTQVVVEVPPLGFAWVPRNDQAVAPKLRIRTAEGNLVRNEFFEAEIDPATGCLKLIRDIKNKIPRMGMQLVYNPGSRCEGRGVRIIHQGTALGEIASDGVILNEQHEELAQFTLHLRAWLMRPLLEISITIRPSHPPTGYPWHAYYGARFAWRDEHSALFRGISGLSFATQHSRPQTPDFLEIKYGRSTTTILTGGLPFLQKNGSRMMDLILIPEGEQETHFELGVLLDRDYPLQSAIGFTTPVTMIPTEKGPPPTGATGWLFQVDSPNLAMLNMTPTPDGQRAIIVTFLETSGLHGGIAYFACFRPPVSAVLLDGDDQPFTGLEIEEHQVKLEFAGGELFRIRVNFE
ncbi:MAG: hypothetical protein R3B84_02595 [Zavarzinella sp.]